MGKATKHENARVVVYPRSAGDLGGAQERTFAETLALCHEIAAQIEGRYKTVHVQVDTVAVCEFCGAAWTEGDSPHNGGCCDKDCEVMDAHLCS